MLKGSKLFVWHSLRRRKKIKFDFEEEECSGRGMQESFLFLNSLNAFAFRCQKQHKQKIDKNGTLDGYEFVLSLATASTQKLKKISHLSKDTSDLKKMHTTSDTILDHSFSYSFTWCD